jgi:glycerol-3-phosphate dehydrogenase
MLKKPTMPDKCDVFVIGGGINGVGIAREAALQGFSVVLCEQHDLAQHTSSASTKLVHGGLRYLEQGHFGLVKKALKERETLLKLAPYLIRPLRFVIPMGMSKRSSWLIRLGLYLYDHLARRDILPASEKINLTLHRAGMPLVPDLSNAFVYSDAWVDDARLVVVNAMDAREHGATILTRTTCRHVIKEGFGWQVTLEGENHQVQHLHARAVVNATGPWAENVVEHIFKKESSHHLRWVKGSHIVVPSLFDHPDAYLLQNPDGRIIFAIPYEEQFTLIGTTDVDYVGKLDSVHISIEEIEYLCEMSNRYFQKKIHPDDVLWTYSGVRPLVEDEEGLDAPLVPRDYEIEWSEEKPPLVTIWGGKLTTYRQLAQEVVSNLFAPLSKLEHYHVIVKPLLGSEGLEVDGHEQEDVFVIWLAKLKKQFSWMPPDLLVRYAKQYGTRIYLLLDGIKSVEELGEELVLELYEREIEYLYQYEWAKTAEDILWRRTKRGLYAGPEDVVRLTEYLKAIDGEE